MKVWWQHKSPSEQRWLILLMLILSLTIAAYGVVIPLNHIITTQRQELKKIQADRVWLDEQALASGVTAAIPATASLEETIQASATAAGLTISLAQKSQQSVVVTASDMALPALVHWLETLRTDQGIFPLEMAFNVSEKDASLITMQTLRLARAE